MCVTYPYLHCMCWWRVLWCLLTISSQFCASTSNKYYFPYVSETQANSMCALGHNHKVYPTHTHSHKLFALPQRKLYNNNSVCKNASNANPHRSNVVSPLGVLPCTSKPWRWILASRQPAVFVYMRLSHTATRNQMLPRELPTAHKLTSVISRRILQY